MDQLKPGYSSMPQSSLFFENYSKTSHSIERDMEQESESVPYLSVISDPRWRPLNSDPQSYIKDESLEPQILKDLKTIAMSPFNQEIGGRSVREEFDKNCITTDFNTNELNFQSWTPWTPTIFGPSLIAISPSNTRSKETVYAVPQNTPMYNQSFSFNSLPPRNNSTTVAFNEIIGASNNDRVSTYSSVLSCDHFSHGSQSPDPPDPKKPLVLPYLHSGQFCQFCKNNDKPERQYRSHILKTQDGRVVCPLLRAYNCPLCNNGGGDYAHTVRYCPFNNRRQFWNTNF